MANSRIARFFMEAAPPQYVSVMRQRTRKMLDTINEDDREISQNSSLNSSPKGSSASKFLAPSSVSASTSKPTANANTQYFLKEVHRSLSILNH
ncbi:hypothetical protein L6164_037455 [Bauhinia variegata]|uniref:Uncharacterized protein n=1 Tax=Bauhinia variegata TaxID=167791 RepID=A0ACB9KK78_BAUVA|nr:hypothetical protein L6164_037455 [Bauhinia variegata]